MLPQIHPKNTIAILYFLLRTNRVDETRTLRTKRPPTQSVLTHKKEGVEWV